MQLALQDFPALVRLQAAAARAARSLVDVSIGSVLRAVLEANASVALWMQWLIMEVLATTRAATSNGADLDSWAADFGMVRLPPVAAVGEVRFSRITPGLAAVVPVGTVVRTSPGSDGEIYQVVADPTRASWTGSGYSIAVDASDVVVPVRASVTGSAGNVAAGVIGLLSSAVPGVDAVVNDAATYGGLDTESDEALRTRFGLFLDSRTRATRDAVAFAVMSVSQGLQYVVVDRYDQAGNARDGFFTVIVDDGSGAPSAALIEAVATAVERVRPLGASYSIVAPNIVQANVAMQIQGPADAVTAVKAAIGAFVGALPIGGWLTLSRLAQLAHDADARIIGVSGATLNGLPQDLDLQTFQRAVLGTVTVTVV